MLTTRERPFVEGGAVLQRGSVLGCGGGGGPDGNRLECGRGTGKLGKALIGMGRQGLGENRGASGR